MSAALLIAEAVRNHRANRYEEAEARYRALLADNSHQPVLQLNLAQILTRMSRYDEAIGTLLELLQDGVDHPAVHKQLGFAYAGSIQLERSLAHFERALAQVPQDPLTLQLVANLQQEMGATDQADSTYRRALAIQPLFTIAGATSPPSFEVLLLFAPGAGNTPFEYLLHDAPWTSHILNVLPGANYDVALLRGRADVVVNLIADADQAAPVLGTAIELTDRLEKPSVNHPRKIVGTDRASMAQRLSDVPGCLVPQVRRYTRAGLSALGFDPRRTSLNFPILARPTGTHGGEQFEMVNCPIELEALVKQNHAAEFYLSHFVDYRSGDGYFRKFRFFFIGGDIFPYHLAIDDQWKVHHATTDMGRHRWMQEEEKHFLEDPHAVFGPRALAALDAIQRAVGLEYFGIDCALDAKGNVLVFEVNACMLAHGNNEAFAYKTEAVLRIKRAFHALLARKASPHQPLPACLQIPGQPSVPRASSKSSS